MKLALETKAIDSAVAALQFRTEAFIGGRFVPAASGARFPTENPATGRPLAEVAACDAADVDLAVWAARKVFEAGTWSRVAPLDRKKSIWMQLS